MDSFYLFNQLTSVSDVSIQLKSIHRKNIYPSMKKPKSYYCHKSQLLQQQLAISNHLQVVQKIGQGAFGEVFKVFDHNSSELKVIKRHKRESSKAVFNKENEIMKQMSGSQGFAKIKEFYSQTAKTKRDSQNSNTYRSAEVNSTNRNQNQKANNQESLYNEMIMMECLGQNLGKIIQKKPVSIFTMKRIAEQLIVRLKELHDKNYVHRDLKPQNILLGNQLNPHKIYLVDFGLVSSYRKDPKKIRKVYDGIIGTAKYCPLASHYGNQQFPKDDLESLGYVLIYLVKGQLPWRFKGEMSDEQKFEQMRILKQNLSVSQSTGGVHCLKKFFNYIKTLEAGSQIDYELLKNLFKTDSQEDYCFEFCRENCFYKMRRFEQSPIIGEKQNCESEKLKSQSFRKIPIEGYHFQSKFIK